MARDGNTAPEKAEKKKFSRRDFVVGSGTAIAGGALPFSQQQLRLLLLRTKEATRFQPNTWFMTASTAPAVTAA